MVTTAGLVYVLAVTVLFFFWVYGIVAFGRDVRRYVLPALRERLERRAEERETARREEEREEREQQLY